MKKFEIITETDARVLPRGDSVMLARRGHITPLAQDTLRERRITVVHEGMTSADEVSLAPKADVRTVAIASDHTGVVLPEGAEPVAYPDVASSVADAVVPREADAGIVIDGAGIGSAIAANKVDGVRAAMATSETIARYSREHNGTNVLTLGATLVRQEEARVIVTTWLTTPMREPRYIRRLAKIRDLERRGS